MDLKTELEKYAFPVEGIDDAEVCRILKLEQPLESIILKAPQLLVYWYGQSHPRFVMSFDKGMGKTIAYLSILYALEPQKMVILCSENAKLAQRREIIRHLNKWTNAWVFVGGNAAQRKKIWNDPQYDIFIATYATLQADMGLRAKSPTSRVVPAWVETCPMACDEWHKVLRSKKSGTYKMLKSFKNSRLILSSGSAGGKGVQDIWAVLNLCDPIKFASYWQYVNKWCFKEETYFGQSYTGCKDIPGWRKLVAPYIFHRRKDLKDYPPKTRQALEVQMEPWQKKAHDQLRKELYAELPGGDLFASPNVMAMLMKLRQFMICPKVISPDFGWGCGLEGILADVQESELKHFVISTPFKDPIPWIEQFFRLHKIPVERLTGGDGCDANEIEQRIARWTKNGGLMIQTIQFAESYELPAARIMYMLGYLHNHEQNMQAEDRIHRDIRVTPHPVDIYYLKALGGYDIHILDALSAEADNIHNLMHKPIKHFIEWDA
jgi:SNF2 family DNA or RNA helicase